MTNDTTMTIIGNLTTDPEFRTTASGVGVVNFTIISKSRAFDREAREWHDHEVVFMRCTVWRQHAENVIESLHKGSRVIVSGRLRQRSFVTRENERRTVMELDVDEIGPTLRFAIAKVTRRVDGNSFPPQVSYGDEVGTPAFGDSPEPARPLALVGGASEEADVPPF